MNELFPIWLDRVHIAVSNEKCWDLSESNAVWRIIDNKIMQFTPISNLKKECIFWIGVLYVIQNKDLTCEKLLDKSKSLIDYAISEHKKEENNGKHKS